MARACCRLGRCSEVGWQALGFSQDASLLSQNERYRCHGVDRPGLACSCGTFKRHLQDKPRLPAATITAHHENLPADATARPLQLPSWGNCSARSPPSSSHANALISQMARILLEVSPGNEDGCFPYSPGADCMRADGTEPSHWMPAYARLTITGSFPHKGECRGSYGQCQTASRTCRCAL